MSKLSSKTWLHDQYHVKKKSLKEIAKQLNVSDQTIYRYMKKHEIPRRTPSEAMKEFYNRNSINSQKKNRLREMGRSRKVNIPKAWLYQWYIIEKKPTTKIADYLNCSVPTVVARLKEANINLRTPSERKTGKLNPSWNKKAEAGFRWKKFHSKKTRQKISKNVPKGKAHFRWKPPEKRIETVNKQIRNCSKMKVWKQEVFKRDKFTCQICNKKRNKHTKINADHIVPFAKIKADNNIDSLKKALKCEALWDVSNGRTLCVTCHKKTETWGQGTKSLLKEDF